MAGLADLLAIARTGEPATPPESSQSYLPNFHALDRLLSRPQPARTRRTRAGAAPASAPAGDWEQMARRMAAQRGWTGQDWRAIDSIIERESGWDPNAVNASSGAYGIPQILPSAHPNTELQSDPAGQIRWLLNYIAERYKTPAAALAFKDRMGWY